MLKLFGVLTVTKKIIKQNEIFVYTIKKEKANNRKIIMFLFILKILY